MQVALVAEEEASWLVDALHGEMILCRVLRLYIMGACARHVGR